MTLTCRSQSETEKTPAREKSPHLLCLLFTHFFEAALLLLERGADPDGLLPCGNSKRVILLV